MLTKRLDGLWLDRLGFVAAIMLQWNQTDADGTDHYVFLSSPFNMFPHDIVSNGEDDSVLLTLDMYNTLLTRKAVRALTDEEAAAANKNLALIELNEVNAHSLSNQDGVVKEANEQAAKTTHLASAKAGEVPKPRKIAEPTPPLVPTVSAAAAIAQDRKGSVAISKKE